MQNRLKGTQNKWKDTKTSKKDTKNHENPGLLGMAFAWSNITFREH